MTCNAGGDVRFAEFAQPTFAFFENEMSALHSATQTPASQSGRCLAGLV